MSALQAMVHELVSEIERLRTENEQISQTESGHWRMAYLKQEAEVKRLRECLKDCVAIIRGEISDPGWAALKTADDLIAASVSKEEK